MSKEPKTPKTPKTKEPKHNVGTVAITAIMAGKDNEEALAAVKAEFKDAKTSLASINWYRNKLRKEGKKVKTARELKKEKAGDKKGKSSDPLA